MGWSSCSTHISASYPRRSRLALKLPEVAELLSKGCPKVARRAENPSKLGQQRLSWAEVDRSWLIWTCLADVVDMGQILGDVGNIWPKLAFDKSWPESIKVPSTSLDVAGSRPQLANNAQIWLASARFEPASDLAQTRPELLLLGRSWADQSSAESGRVAPSVLRVWLNYRRSWQDSGLSLGISAQNWPKSNNMWPKLARVSSVGQVWPNWVKM